MIKCKIVPYYIAAILFSIIFIGCTEIRKLLKINSSEDITSHEEQGWKNLGFTPEEAYQWKKVGCKAWEASLWKEAGFTLEEASQWDANCNVKRAQGWKEKGFTPNEASYWEQYFFDWNESPQWKGKGFDPEKAAQWRKCDFLPDDSAKWKGKGFDPEKAARWKKYDFKPEDSIRWLKAGFESDQANIWHLQGFTISQATKLNKTCKNEFVEESIGLSFDNPYDVQGRCFEFSGKRVKVFERTRALYLSDNNFFYLDFGTFSAPLYISNSIVRGIGTYKDVSTSGIIPKLLVMIPISK